MGIGPPAWPRRLFDDACILRRRDRGVVTWIKRGRDGFPFRSSPDHGESPAQKSAQGLRKTGANGYGD